MVKNKTEFIFMNIAHAYDHMFLLFYATVVLALGDAFPDKSYGEILLPSTFGFVAFGVCSLPAGWLGDHWSRQGMMVVFFIGIGAASIVTGFAEGLFQIGVGLALIGIFAAIYHPVGIAMVSQNAIETGKAMGINGVVGNLGLAAAPVTAGVLIHFYDWRMAFIVPGVVSIITGIFYWMSCRRSAEALGKKKSGASLTLSRRDQILVVCVIAIATSCGGIIFHSTTVSLPKVFDERLLDLGPSMLGVTWIVAGVLTLASITQVIVGHLLDRYSLRTVFIGTVLIQVPMLALAASSHNWAMIGVGVMMMVGVFGQIPITDFIIAKYTASNWRARMYSLKYTLSFCVSITAVPLVANLRDNTGGFDMVFYTLSGLAVLVLCAALVVPVRNTAAEEAMAAE
jgi:MFS family permease